MRCCFARANAGSRRATAVAGPPSDVGEIGLHGENGPRNEGATRQPVASGDRLGWQIAGEGGSTGRGNGMGSARS